MPSNRVNATFSALRKHLLERRDHVPVQEEDPCRNPVLEALVCDTQTAALLTAVTASSINALANGSTAIELGGLKRFAPPEPSAVVAMRGCLPEAGVDPGAICAIQDFFAALAEARRGLERYFVDAEQLGAGRAQLLHTRTLANTWRSVCLAASEAVRAFNAALPDWLPRLYYENGVMLSELLERCAKGGTPCLDAMARPFLPNMPQRRRSVRRAICEPCVLTWRRKAHSAFVRDLSAGGFGLERVPELEAGELVVVQMASGRRFTAVVAWRKGHAAGVRLGTPLAPNDPLLVG